jgi:hypothetical protein
MQAAFHHGLLGGSFPPSARRPARDASGATWMKLEGRHACGEGGVLQESCYG